MASRILLMVRELNLGGSERQMTETAKFLDRGQFEPRVGCFLPNGMRAEELRKAGVPVVHFPLQSYKSRATLSVASQLVQYIRDEKIELVHTWDYPLNVFAVPVARVFTRAVAVSSQRSHRAIVSPGYRRFLRVSDKFAHAVVVNCRYLERHLSNDEGVAPGRIELCMNGIDLDVFRPAANRPLEPLVIGTVAGLLPWKGQATLLDAFARIRHLQPGLRLVLVGSGPDLENLQARARELTIQDHVTFQPGTSAVADWLHQIHIFVLPSLSEALSNALMEAMACGCCTVASNVGGNWELVRDGETGKLFEAGNPKSLADVLAALIDSSDLRCRFAQNGMRFIRENYSIQAAAQSMGYIYKRLLTRHRTGP